MRGEERRSTLGQGLVYDMNTDDVKDYVSLCICCCLVAYMIMSELYLE